MGDTVAVTKTGDGTTIIDIKDKPLEVRVDTRPFNHCGATTTHSFNQGVIRRALMQGFDPCADYFFTHTLAHSDAVDEIAKKEHLEPYAKHRGIDHDDFDLAFDAKLMYTYLRAIQTVMTSNKRRRYVRWPLVHTHKFHESDLPSGASLWPVVHVSKGIQAGKFFLKHVQDMHSDMVYEAIKKYEHPQNYNMFQINLLRDKGIPPLQLGRSWCTKGADFAKAMDFLVPFHYNARRHDSSLLDD